MTENSNPDNRKEALKLITISICLLEFIITIGTFFYQQDTKTRTEIPISEEMAMIYMQYPEKLKSNEKLGINRYSSNQKSYIVINDEIIHRDFPWKGWILLSIGAPITLAFLISLVAKAYFQATESDDNANQNEQIQNKWIQGFNTLSKINITWFMLILIIAVFALWYIPDMVKYAGNITMSWLNQYWWIPTMVIILLFIIAVVYLFLQYKLKLNAMHINMEMEKLQYLQLDTKKETLSITARDRKSVPLIQETTKQTGGKEI